MTALRLLLLVLVVLGSASGAPAAADNPFRPGQTGERPADGPAAPRFLSGLVTEVAQVQRQVYGRMATEIRRVRETGAWTPAVVLLALSFAYGVFHAVGPGHGKAVVAAYFASRPARLGSGIAMGGLIAFTQAVSAILVVCVLAVALNLRHREIMQEALTVELASYGLIMLIGVLMAVEGLRELVLRRTETATLPDERGAGMAQGLYRRLRAAKVGRLWSMGLAAGVRPCGGSILVLLFTLANGVFLLGLAAALVMALGVAITISTLGIATILTRRSIAAAPFGGGAWVTPLHGAVTLAGALLIVGLGGLMMAAAWERGALFG